MRCRRDSCLLVLRGNGGGGGDADDATDDDHDDDDDASFQRRFIGSICKALMEPPTLEMGNNSFYSPLHSYHTIVFYVQFFIYFFIRSSTENSCSSRPVIISICCFHWYAARHCGILLEEVNSNFRVRVERADERAERTFASITTNREPKPELFPE